MAETPKRCQVEMGDGKRCGRELYDGEHCIFHSKKEDKDLNLFHGEFYQIFNDKSLNTYDFTGFIFPEGVVFLKKFSKPVNFVGAIFKGDVDFSNVTFEDEALFAGAKFKCEANFLDAAFKNRGLFPQTEFEGVAIFSDATFKGRADFLFARFTHTAWFRKATFEAGAGFDGTDFVGEADFGHTTFKGAADFLSTLFHGNVKFSVARFHAEFKFEGSTFKGQVDFQSATFNAGAYFIGSIFEADADFRGATFEHTLLIGAERVHRRAFKGGTNLGWVQFSKPEKVGFHKVDLSSVRFLGTDVRKVHFNDVDWYKEKGKGRNRVFDEVSPDPDTEKFDYPLIAQLYRRFRANYEENLRYSEAGDFYIGEMEMTRKAERNIFKQLPLLIYKAISNYGESYYRPLGWLAAFLVVIFPLLFMILGLQPINPVPNSPEAYVMDYKWDISSIQSFLPSRQKLNDYGISFLYTMSVFSLVRDKKYTTINNWGHALFVAESILTPVFMAFFLLALRRRFKR